MASDPASKWYFRSSDPGLPRVLGPGVATRIFFGRNVMFSLVEIAPHTISAFHSHPEEQWGYLLEGECIRTQDGEEVAMQAGDFWYTPANVLHGVRTEAKGARVLDVFSPPRELYTKPGAGLVESASPDSQK